MLAPETRCFISVIATILTYTINTSKINLSYSSPGSVPRLFNLNISHCAIKFLLHETTEEGMAAELLTNIISKDHDKVTDGSCLCGSIKYRLIGAPSTTVLCHCISCKKASGSLFQANGFYNDSVRIFLFPLT